MLRVAACTALWQSVDMEMQPRADFQLWHLHDAGDVDFELKVRYQDDQELPDWQNGPSVAEAQAAAQAEGWELFDREPGNAPGEYAILHLVRHRT
jgi:hypothetical protein